MELIGNTYVLEDGDDIPEAVFGYERNDSDGSIYYATNTIPSTWVANGNANRPLQGYIETSGSFIEVAMTNPSDSGLASLETPAFLDLSINGVEVAKASDISNITTYTSGKITSLINSAFGRLTSSVGSVSELALGHGRLTFNMPHGITPPAAQEIPRPVFASDGTLAGEDKCVWLVRPDYPASAWWDVVIPEDQIPGFQLTRGGHDYNNNTHPIYQPVDSRFVSAIRVYASDGGWNGFTFTKWPGDIYLDYVIIGWR